MECCIFGKILVNFIFTKRKKKKKKKILIPREKKLRDDFNKIIVFPQKNKKATKILYNFFF